MSSLSDHIRPKAAIWVSDKSINPAGAKIEIHSVYPGKEPGTIQASFDVVFTYAIWIQALLTPFYILFALFSINGGIEWLEDIAYFKRITPHGINKKRRALEETRAKVQALIEAEARAYNKNEDPSNG